MIIVISAARRSAALTSEAFKHAMQVEHAPLVARFPALQSYRMRFALENTKAPWDVVVELRFPDQAAFQQALASPEGQQALEHMRQIVDVASIQSGMFEELPDAATGAR